MDTCVTVNVNIGGQNSFSLTQTIDKSEHLKSLVTSLRAVQSETNRKLTDIINQTNGTQDATYNGDNDAADLEVDGDDDSESDNNEPAEKQQKLQ